MIKPKLYNVSLTGMSWDKKKSFYYGAVVQCKSKFLLKAWEKGLKILIQFIDSKFW